MERDGEREREMERDGEREREMERGRIQKEREEWKRGEVEVIECWRVPVCRCIPLLGSQRTCHSVNTCVWIYDCVCVCVCENAGVCVYIYVCVCVCACGCCESHLWCVCVRSLHSA